ncbi:exo-alpha-sialidase [Kribbella italica]|uniref:Exo-alpha-sialidase n=1 Tax=Kribbella italica TaxID=1540520 RepID=A0A7W9J625_9ACTN|nr:exo-alpha-sialidase [Kribbella italica]MBB5835795.1 hypothetical protein [Kribbella italica]
MPNSHSADREPSRRALIAGAAATVVACSTAGATRSYGASEPTAGSRPRPFGPVTVYAPPAGTEGWGVKYARLTQVPGSARRPSTLVSTCENLFDPVDYAFLVFRSTDGGRRWGQIGKVEDSRSGVKPRWQPALYTLPEPFAGLPRGALLAAGNTIPDDYSSTRIDVLASLDGGRSWHHRGTVARGGPPIPNNGETPVWEPFLLLHRRRLICYYSDQRDPGHGQKLVHQTSTDLVHWGPVVNDQADPVYDRRPGMPAVAQLGDGRWILTWEDGNNSEVSFGVAYKIAADPERFSSVAPQLLRTAGGLVPIGSPTVAWSPVGGKRGTIVVSAGENEELFLNRAGGNGSWTTMTSLVPRGYSRQVQLGRGGKILTIGGGPGNFPPPQLNKVQFGIDTVPVIARGAPAGAGG